jgi:hypothetical protein
MSRASEAHATVEEVFASLAPSGATLVWDDASTFRTLFDGSVEGMSVDLSDSSTWIRFKVAERLQTIFMEATETMVPPCPRHPESHPLACRVVENWAVWQCPRDDETVRPV